MNKLVLTALSLLITSQGFAAEPRPYATSVRTPSGFVTVYVGIGFLAATPELYFDEEEGEPGGGACLAYSCGGNDHYINRYTQGSERGWCTWERGTDQSEDYPTLREAMDWCRKWGWPDCKSRPA